MKKTIIACVLLGTLAASPTVLMAETSTRFIYGKMGGEITSLQEKLKTLGYTIDVTGTYDTTTMAAVAAFQRANKLSIDGVAGQKTLAAIETAFSLKAPVPAPVVQKDISTTPPLACDIKNTVPQIRVDSPNGKETAQAGSELSVAWTTCNVPANAQLLIQMIRVNSSNQPASNSWIVLSSGTDNDGAETVTIPGDIPAGNYALAIKTAISNTPSDTSDMSFRVSAPTACLAPKVAATTSSSPDVLLTKSSSDLLKFTVTNQNPVGSNCPQKVRAIDVSYVSTSGVRYHEKLLMKSVSDGELTVYDESLGGYRFFPNQNDEKTLFPGDSNTYVVQGELVNIFPNIAYRGLMLGVARVQYEDGPKKTLKLFTPKSIIFGNRFTIQ